MLTLCDFFESLKSTCKQLEHRLCTNNLFVMKFSRYIRLAIDIFDHNLRIDGGSHVSLLAMFMHDTANRHFRAP